MTKQEVRKKWVEALRSGEYKQGRGALNKDNKFCCLGVLCDLAVKEGVIPPPTKGTISPYYLYGTGDHKVSGVLPQEVMDWVGARSGAGEFWEPRYRTLAGINDSDDSTFEEIASIIESEPRGLFVEEKNDEERS